jgi:tetratricopeptide (TPR) repeat protein
MVPVACMRQAPASPPSQIAPDRLFSSRRLGAIVVLSAALLIYLPSLTGLFVWDDAYLVFRKAAGRSFAQCFTQPFLYRYYRPLASLSFYVENRIQTRTETRPDGSVRPREPNPLFYHQTNILLHVLGAGMVLGMLGAAFPGRRAASLLGALIFAVQPAQVGAVAWIGGRPDALAELFVAAWGWSLIRCARRPPSRRVGPAWLCALLYGLALLTKEQALVLLPLAPLAFLCFGGEEGSGRAGRVDWRAVAPTLLAAAAFIASWVVLLKADVPPTRAVPAPFAFVTILHYALLLVAPAKPLLFMLTLAGYSRLVALWAALGALILGGCAWLFALWLRRAPSLAWMLALALLPILPVANFMPSPSLVVAPYRVALAGIGVGGLLGSALGAAWERLSLSGRRPSLLRSLAAAAGAALLLWYAFVTVFAETRWRTEPDLFGTILRYDPGSYTAVTDLDQALYPVGRYAESRAALTRYLDFQFGSAAWRSPAGAIAALKSDPGILLRVRANKGTDADAISMLSRIFGHLGNACVALNDLPAAQAALETGYDVHPDFVSASALAKTALIRGDDAQATLWFRRAADLAPGYGLPLCSLGDIFMRRREDAAARGYYLASIRAEPGVKLGYERLASLALRSGDQLSAQEWAARAADAPIAEYKPPRAPEEDR